MEGLKRTFILSAVFHAALISIVGICLCTGTGFRVPINSISVSLFEESTGDKTAYAIASPVQEKTRVIVLDEVVSRKQFQKDDTTTIYRDRNEQENIPGDKKALLTSGVERNSRASGIQIQTNIDIPRGHPHGENSDMSAPDDLNLSIRNAIMKVQNYPLLARKRKIEGTVITVFGINEKGHPGDLKIKKSSGYEILDSAALNIVTKAAPFPKVSGKIVVPITFKLTETVPSN
jgi:TonB family protein